MRIRHWILVGFFGAYALAWLAAWLRLRLAGDRSWIEGLTKGLRKVGELNARIVLSILYLLLLPFFSAYLRLKDAIDVQGRPRGTFWRDVKKVPATAERYRRPF